MENPWRIEMFGGLRLVQGDTVVSRFRSTKNGSLLAYLAFYPHKQAFRDAVIEQFWPDAEIEAARNNFRVASNSLRHQLEPPGVPMGAVLVADRVHISLNPGVFVTDVAEFEAALHSEELAEDDETKSKLLQKAIGIYAGDLLAGWADEWIDPERTRLSDQYLGALRRITRILVERKDFDHAVDYAHKAVAADPMREQSHVNLMRLYVAMGRPTAALQQYKELARIFREELGSAPSGPTREFAKQLAEGIERLPSRNDGIPSETPAKVKPIKASVGEAPLPRKGNLPIQFNQFLDRDKELREIGDILTSGAAHTLVTITGPGGIGKTRLGIEAANRLRAEFDERIWFIALADVLDAKLIPNAIASALRLTPDPHREIMDQIVSALSLKCNLLVFDNFEQIAEEGSLILNDLFTQVPTLKVVVTSQLILGIVGEIEYPLAPLSAPAADSNPKELLQFSAVKLFVDRAQSVRPDFQITPRNVASVAELCRRLEGIPLAIELAAAWAQMLTPNQMLDRLSERFDLLVNPRRASTSRHQTLKTAIDWSYQLLPKDLQEFFAGLSVFHGGWTIAAAAEVSGLKMSETLVATNQLRSRSLLFAVETDDGMRFGMLESIREFASELLVGEELKKRSQSHSRFYSAQARLMSDSITGSGAGYTLNALEADYGNFRAVLARYPKGEPSQFADQIAAALWRFWLMKGRVSEGRSAIADRLSGSSTPELTYKLCHGAGRLAAAQGDHVEARSMFVKALDLLEKDTYCNSETRLQLLADLAMSNRELGDMKALILNLKDRLLMLDPLICRGAVARTLDALTFASKDLGDIKAAKEFGLQSTSVKKAMCDVAGVADSLYLLAEICGELGEAKESQKLLAEASEVQTSVLPEALIVGAYLQLSGVSYDRGDYPDAAALCGDAISAIGETGGELHSLALEELCTILLGQNDMPAFVESLKELTASRIMEKNVGGDSALFGLIAAGLLKVGKHELAVTAFSACAEAAGSWKDSENSIFATTLKTGISDKDFAAHWKTGRNMSLDDALAKALPVLQM